MAYFEKAGQVVALQDMSLTMTKKTLIEAIIANIGTMTTEHNELNELAGNKINDLKALIDQFSGDANQDLELINGKIVEINKFLTENGEGLNVISALNQLYTEMNRREETKTFEKVVNTSNGILDVNLDSFGFDSVNDYNLQVTPYGYNAGMGGAYAEKVSKNLARVHLTDAKEWEFNADEITRFDASTNNVKIALTVSRIPVAMSKTLTEPDGDQTTIGAGAGTVDVVAPDAPTATLTKEADEKLTISGIAEAGATVKVVFPDNSEKTVVVGVDGAYSLTSTNAITASGNVVVNATDASGNVGVATIISYTYSSSGGGNDSEL
jgi:hypothetical protein